MYRTRIERAWNAHRAQCALDVAWMRARFWQTSHEHRMSVVNLYQTNIERASNEHRARCLFDVYWVPSRSGQSSQGHRASIGSWVERGVEPVPNKHLMCIERASSTMLVACAFGCSPDPGERCAIINLALPPWTARPLELVPSNHRTQHRAHLAQGYRAQGRGSKARRTSIPNISNSEPRVEQTSRTHRTIIVHGAVGRTCDRALSAHRTSIEHGDGTVGRPSIRIVFPPTH